MLARLSQVLIRRRRWVWVGAVLFVVVAGGLGSGVASHLSSGGFADPAAESSKAAEALAKSFGQTNPNLVMVLTAKTGSVDDPANAEAGAALNARLSGEKYISVRRLVLDAGIGAAVEVD